MNSQKKQLIAIKVNNVIDIITNSSDALFVLQGKTKEIVNEMIENIYPNYRDEYQELKDIRDFTDEEIDTFLQWHLGRKSSFWSSGELYDKSFDYVLIHGFKELYDKSFDYVLIHGFKFEELYDTNVKLGHYPLNSEYKIKNNIPIKKRKSKWDFCFVTNDNRERVIKGIEKSVGRFFLYSIVENPEWEMQEKLMEIGKRYHLG